MTEDKALLRQLTNSILAAVPHLHHDRAMKAARAAILAYEAAKAAPDGAVASGVEVIAALLSEKPFVFDPATNFAHADDGGAPKHGILWVPVDRTASGAACRYCDGTGDVHSLDGEWRGRCTCGAAPPPAVEAGAVPQEVVAWRAVAHPETGMGAMIHPIKRFLIQDADGIYGKGQWDLQALVVSGEAGADASDATYNVSEAHMLGPIEDSCATFTIAPASPLAKPAPEPAGDAVLEAVAAGPWICVETRPLPTGKYLVGHRGHQEIIWFFGQDRDWCPGTKFGWQKEPAIFNATHCALISSPTKDAALAASPAASPAPQGDAT